MFRQSIASMASKILWLKLSLIITLSKKIEVKVILGQDPPLIKHHKNLPIRNNNQYIDRNKKEDKIKQQKDYLS